MRHRTRQASSSLLLKRRVEKGTLTVTVELLNFVPNTSRLDLNAFACVTRVLAGIGRALLGVIAISLITMPYTQHIWTWDHFLHGGQDFEFTVLVLLTSLCLVLLLAQHCKQSIARMLANWRHCWIVRRKRTFANSTSCERILVFRRGRGSSPALSLYTFPLQI